jgi:hypothetical protein
MIEPSNTIVDQTTSEVITNARNLVPAHWNIEQVANQLHNGHLLPAGGRFNQTIGSKWQILRHLVKFLTVLHFMSVQTKCMVRDLRQC